MTDQPRATPDTDPQETQEWRDAFAALLAGQGAGRARFILDELAVLDGVSLEDLISKREQVSKIHFQPPAHEKKANTGKKQVS